MLGNSNFGDAFQPTKMAYRLGDRFNNLAPPAIERAHAGGLIIQMPLEEVKQYLERVISLDVLASDDDLVLKLDDIIGSSRVRPLQLPPCERVELSLRASVVFAELDEQQQRKVVARARSFATEEAATKEGKRKL